MIKTSIVLAAILFGTVSFANDGTISPDNTSGKVVKVELENMKRGTLLTIKDRKGIILFKEKIKTTGSYSKGFDLSSLPVAEYYLELNKKDEIIVSPFKIEADTVAFLEDREYNISKPIVRLKNDYVYISKVSKEKQAMKIEVYFEGNELVYSEKMKSANIQKRTYDFSSSIKGQYIIVINTEGRTFSHNVFAGTMY